MHFEFSSHTHTHTHTVSCSLAVYLCPPRPTCVFQFDIKPFRAHTSHFCLCKVLACVGVCVYMGGCVAVRVYVRVCVRARVCLCGVSGKRISRLLPPHIKINRRKCVLASYFASAQPRLSWGYFWAPFSSLSMPPLANEPNVLFYVTRRRA